MTSLFVRSVGLGMWRVMVEKCRKCGRRDAVEDGLCESCRYGSVLDVLKWK